MAAAGVGLFLTCWLMCACVHILATNYTNCSMEPYVEPRRGKRLAVSIIANVTAETIRFCASTCLKRSACKSFNYNVNAIRYQCQLNEFDNENETQDEPNYRYSSISDWNPVLVDSCANHNCSEDSICIPTLSQKYTCLQLDIQCRAPRLVEYTRVRGSKVPNPRHYKSEIKYTCEWGYEYLSGNSKSVCQLNMTWSELNLKCSKVICGLPPNITNMDLKNHTGIDYGSTAYYECMEGFNSSRHVGWSQCTANRTWTEPNINCTEISCGLPLNSSTAEVASFNGTSIGDVVEYSCIENAILISSKNTSVCTSNGTWSKPVKCGFCSQNLNITYQGRQVCYKRSMFEQSYFSLSPSNVLIASEQPAMDLFQQEAIKIKSNVFAGFQVNSTHLSFFNGTNYNISSVGYFDLRDCLNGICVYNSTGHLTNLPPSQTEAFGFTFYQPS